MCTLSFHPLFVQRTCAPTSWVVSVCRFILAKSDIIYVPVGDPIPQIRVVWQDLADLCVCWSQLQVLILGFPAVWKTTSFMAISVVRCPKLVSSSAYMFLEGTIKLFLVLNSAPLVLWERHKVLHSLYVQSPSRSREFLPWHISGRVAAMNVRQKTMRILQYYTILSGEEGKVLLCIWICNLFELVICIRQVLYIFDFQRKEILHMSIHHTFPGLAYPNGIPDFAILPNISNFLGPAGVNIEWNFSEPRRKEREHKVPKISSALLIYWKLHPSCVPTIIRR